MAKRDRPEVLSSALKNKVERYVVFWRQESGAVWPVQADVSDGTKAASWIERTADRAIHGLLRSRDLIVPFAYSFVPVSVWKSYRQVKSRYQKVADKPSGSEAI